MNFSLPLSFKFPINIEFPPVMICPASLALLLCNNTIAINYTIPCTLYPAIWSEAKNTVDFTMSAVTINTGNKNACMQFNSSLVLGDAENDTILTWGTSAAAWSLSVR